MKSKFTRKKTILAILLAVFVLVSWRNNPPDGRTGAPGEGLCTDCHSQDFSINGIATITGLPATINAGQTYPISVSASVTSGTAPMAGFQIVAINVATNTNAGSMANPTGGSIITPSGGKTYCEHQGGPQPTPAIWTFDWTAPMTPDGATLKMYLAVNLVNNNFNNSGDRVLTTTAEGTLMGAALPPTIQITSTTNVSCFGGNDGSLTATASGGTPGYNYLWSNGQSGMTAIGLTAGAYSVTVTDMANMTASTMGTVTQPQQLGITIVNIQPVDCFGNANGGAEVLGNGGTPGYTYNWSNGASGLSISNVSANTYTVSVTDANFCVQSQPIVITQPQELQANIINTTHVDCNGNSTGSATVSPSGGTPGFNVLWSTGDVGNTANNLAAGNYSVTVTDQNNCTAMKTVSITEPDELIANASATPETMPDANDGTATADPMGGSPFFSYDWSNGQSSQTISNLPPGDYTVTVTDGNLCTDIETVTVVGVNCTLMGNVISTQNIVCAGDITGRAEVEGVDGNAPYSYAWSNGDMDNIAEDLGEGMYTVTISDMDNCEIVLLINIDQVDNEIPIVAVQDITVYLDDNGETLLQATDFDNGSFDNCGIDSFDIEPATNRRLSSLLLTCANLDSVEVLVTVVDVNGNEATATAVAVVKDTIPPTITCPADVTILSCTDTFFYALPTVSDNCMAGPVSLVSGLGSGSIFPTGTTVETYEAFDIRGNSTTCSFNVTVMNTLNGIATGSTVACHADETGVASVNASGGNPDYTYNWSNGQSGSFLDNLTAGTYLVTTTDDAGCIDIDTAFVVQPDSVSIVVNDVQNATTGQNNGSIEVTPIGGSGSGYTISWTGPNGYAASTSTISGLEPGIYNCTVMDANNCVGNCPPIEVEESTGIIDPTFDSSISIYPNPGFGKVFFEFNFKENADVELRLVNYLGKTVRSVELENVKSEKLNLSLTNMPDGIYYFQIRSKDKYSLKRWIKASN